MTAIDSLVHLWPLQPLHAAAAIAAAAVVLVLASRTLPDFVNSRKTKRHMSVTVKWGREKLHLPLPPPDASLGTLRTSLAEHTGLPPNAFKLVHAGAVMKDDTAPISAYHIRAGSTIALIGGGDALAPPREGISKGSNGSANGLTAKKNAKTPQPTTEEGTIAVIHAELASVQHTIVPALDAFLASLSPPPSSTSSAPAPSPAPLLTATSAPSSAKPAPPSTTSFTPAQAAQEHTRLGELLLQALLRLDVLNFDGAWADARRERKGAVRTVQELLDRLDGGWKARADGVAGQN